MILSIARNSQEEELLLEQEGWRGSAEVKTGSKKSS
jgi:hypothetical protein